MTKTYITLIVLILAVGGFLFFLGKGKKVEAPIVIENNAPVSSTMPVPGTKGVKEMMVVEVKEFIVSGQNYSFTPDVITVKKGDKVKIIFKNTEGFHDFRIDEYGIASKQSKSPTEEVLEFTAEKVGSFEYYCSVDSHRSMGMKGILKVE